MLSSDQRRGVITLVPKKGKDLCMLKHWRPISLLNVDYKILTNVLAMRLQTVLDKIISHDQVGYIKGRFIGVNIRTCADILTYCQNTGKKGLIAQIDFQKAFDTVNWSFMLKCLKAFNFGETFISWVKILYTDIESCVTNNGKSSEFFNLERGIRQGCCLSALLFIIVVETLAISIRNNENIKGITVNDEEFKINQLADDTTLYLSEVSSFQKALETLEKFSVCSGLCINREKTEVVPINVQPFVNNNLGISWQKGSFKLLGIWFSSNENKMIELTLNDKLERIKNSIMAWSNIKLAMFGKIIVLKTMVLSQILNICSTVYMPDYFIKQVDSIFFQFLWGQGKRAKVKML